MEMGVHVFNISDPMIGALYSNGAGNYSPENLPTTSHSVEDATPVQKIVATIFHAAGGSQIRILRTVAHGDSGVYNFPYLWNANLVSEEYKQLRRVFAPNVARPFSRRYAGSARSSSPLYPDQRRFRAVICRRPRAASIM